MPALSRGVPARPEATGFLSRCGAAFKRAFGLADAAPVTGSRAGDKWVRRALPPLEGARVMTRGRTTHAGAGDVQSALDRLQRKFGVIKLLSASEVMALPGPRRMFLLSTRLSERDRRVAEPQRVILLGDAPGSGADSRWFNSHDLPGDRDRVVTHLRTAYRGHVYRYTLGSGDKPAGVLFDEQEGGAARLTEEFSKLQLAPDAMLDKELPDFLDGFPARGALVNALPAVLQGVTLSLVLDYAASSEPVSAARLPALHPGDMIRLQAGSGDDDAYDELEFVRYKVDGDRILALLDAGRFDRSAEVAAERARDIARALGADVDHRGRIALTLPESQPSHARARQVLGLAPAETAPPVRPRALPTPARSPDVSTTPTTPTPTATTTLSTTACASASTTASTSASPSALSGPSGASQPARRPLDLSSPPQAGDRVWVRGEAYEFDEISRFTDTKEDAGLTVRLRKLHDDPAQEELLDFDPSADLIEVEDTASGGA